MTSEWSDVVCGRLVSRLMWCLAGLAGLALWLSAGVADACNMSSQDRLFPLGMAKDGLIVLQLRATRGGMKKITWEGKASLRWASPNGKWRKQTRPLGQFKIDDRHYQRDLQPILAKAFAVASKFNGFQAASAPKLGFCHFRKRCPVGGKTYRLQASAKGALVLWEQKGKALPLSRQIPLSGKVKAQLSTKMTGTFQKAKVSEKARWLREFALGSYRLYKSAGRLILILNLAMGGRMVKVFDKKGKEKEVDSRTFHKPQWKRCSSSRRCLPKDPALWHGLAFDTMVILP